MALSLAVINARLWSRAPSGQNPYKEGTLDFPKEHDALGVIEEKISIIGKSEDILSRCDSNTIIIDAKNGMLLPGFTDSHIHFLDGGYRLLSVNLRNCSSKEEFVTTLKEYVNMKPPGSWILGGNWDHQRWDGVLPDKTWIDDVTKENPVWLNRSDGHMCLANSLAMKIAGVGKDTPDKEGGTIVRFHEGEPTGIFKDNATNLVTPFIPKRSKEEGCEALEAAMTYVAERGVTKVHTMVTVDCQCGLWPKNMGRDADKQDIDLAFEELSLYQSFMLEKKLRTRIRSAVPIGGWKRLMTDFIKAKPVPFENIAPADIYENVVSVSNTKERNLLYDPTEYLQIGALKAQMDGSLGTHTAAFLEDYVDTPGFKGTFVWDPAVLEQFTLDASVNKLQVCIHAIGDNSNKVTLDVIENVSKRIREKITDNKDCNLDLRFRIEHAQHLEKGDASRFSALNVIPSMQMSHLADDGRWATSVIGDERMKTSWAMRSLLDNDAVVALGSDWFVAEPTPLQGIYDAVTRSTADGKHLTGLVPSEKVSVEEALIGYTSAAAYAAFEEDRRGYLSVGMLADLVLLDQNIIEIDVAKILETNVMMTVVGGKIVFNKTIAA